MTNDLIPAEQQPEEPKGGALSDLRACSLSMPVEHMQVALAEYQERRRTFREWLLSQLVQGLHFGYPPGCEPKYDDKGNLLVYMRGKYVPYPKEQWTPKPSFYAAGADFVCDLLGIRAEYEADVHGWQQLGGKPGTFVYLCRLVSRSTGEVVGEGRGVRAEGQKNGDANNAIKMAHKSAKVAAVLDAYGLRDLFTQDMEHKPPAPPVYDNPSPNEEAPAAQPRGARVTADHLKNFVERWKALQISREFDATPEAFADWVRDATQKEFAVRQPSAWSMEDLQLCEQALKNEEKF